MAHFDTAEFEVVKSRRTVLKERKEIRAAAERAKKEAAAARKAAQVEAQARGLSHWVGFL